MRELGATEVAVGVTAGAGLELQILPFVEVVARGWDQQPWGDVSLIS